MSLPHLDQLDSDGAIRETADVVGLDTRSDFLRKAALGGGALVGSGALMGLLPEFAAARPSKKRDVAILNFALVLEYLEAAFYKEALRKGALSGDVLEFCKIVADHEATHVSALRGLIRGAKSKPVKSPEFDFRDTTEDQGRFLETSYDLENTGVKAYLGQATRLKSKSYLGQAGSILTTEARHSAAVAVLIGDTPFDVAGNSITPAGAFDRGRGMKKIGKIVADTKFIKKSKKS